MPTYNTSCSLRRMNEEDSLEIGRKIRAIRIARNIKQKDLLERASTETLQISQQALSRVEKLKSKRSVFFPPLAKAMGFSVDELASLSIGELLALYDRRHEPSAVADEDRRGVLVTLFDAMDSDAQTRLVAYAQDLARPPTKKQNRRTKEKVPQE